MSVPVEKLQHLLDAAVADGSECGVQLVVYEHGKLAADLCAGYADAAHTVKVTPKTVFPVFSVGKGLAATAFLMMQEQLGFDLDMPVSEVWPEYGCNGKENTRIWHFLSHRSGMQKVPEFADNAKELADWEGMCRRLEQAAPAWEPGTKCAYHGVTYGWLVGETANRLLKGSFRDFFRDEVLVPLKLTEEFSYGLPHKWDARAAEIDDHNSPDAWVAVFCRNLKRCFLPSATGFGTAGALAKIYNALFYGAEGCAPLLKQSTLDDATQLRRAADDPIPPEGTWAKFGLGYAMPLWESAGNDVFGHGGACGAQGLFCRSKDLAVGFTKNIVTPTHPVHPLRDEICKALGFAPLHW